ncbi:MAG: HEAT repeat domain-containing protein [Gammaproteobacteria bacterium]
MNNIGLLLAFVLFSPCVFAASNNQVSGTPAASELFVGVDSQGNFRVTAARMPLRAVAEVIRQNTGVRFHISARSEEPITVSCSGTVAEVIRCVAGDRYSKNMMWRYGAANPVASGSPRPEEIWILHSAKSQPDFDNVGISPSQCQPERSNFTGRDNDQKTDPSEPSHLSSEERDELLARIGSDDIVAATQAIMRLASAATENEEEVRDSLQIALTAEEPAIRAQAVSVLASRDAPGIDRILDQALLDPDVDVRLMAVDYAGNDESLLLRALEDSDPNVRLLAKTKLGNLEGSDNRNTR